MLDLLVRNANLPDGRNGIDIAVKDGRIVELKSRIDAEAKETIDASGRLVTPPFIDAHFHMDSTLSLGQVLSTSAARITPIRAALAWPVWGSAQFTLMWLMSPQHPEM